MDTTSAFVIRTTVDLLAMVPFVIGFQPTASVVMLTCAGPTAMHARVDLPASPTDDEQVLDQLLSAATCNQVATAAFVLYTDDVRIAARLTDLIMLRFLLAGIGVLIVLRVHEDRWFALVDGVAGARVDGVPFDIDHHPLTMRGVLEGRITYRSREALAASLDPDPDGVAAVRAILPDLPVPQRGEGAAHRVRAVVRRHLRGGRVPDAELVAELATLLAEEATVERVVHGMRRDAIASARAEFWCGVLRRTPPELLAPVAAVTAMAAWLAGEGALAWCAVDRADAAGPRHPVAALVAEKLQGAVPPRAWGA